MKRSKTNRRVNKSSDHGICYCYNCEIEKNEQYFRKKYPSNKGVINEELVHYASSDDLDKLRCKAYKYLL